MPAINDWIAFTNGGTKPMLGVVVAVGDQQVAVEVHHKVQGHTLYEVVMVTNEQIREVRAVVDDKKGKKK